MVMMIPPASRPGITSFASAPTMSPKIAIPIKLNMAPLLRGGRCNPRAALSILEDELLTAVLQLRPSVLDQDAADVVGSRHRQLQRVVVLGAVHHAIEEPGDRDVRGRGEERGVGS